MMSGGLSKAPPFLLPGLLMVILILGFNYYRSNRLNGELLQKLNINLSNHEKELTKLKGELSDVANTERSLRNTHKHLQEEHVKTQTELTRAQEEAARDRVAVAEQKNDFEQQLAQKQAEIMEKINELDHKKDELDQLRTQKDGDIITINKTLSGMRDVKVTLLKFIGEQLGREGIETVLRSSNILPDPYQLPSYEDVPQCKRKYYEQAKAEFATENAQAAKNVGEKAALINSPNMVSVLKQERDKAQEDQGENANTNLVDQANKVDLANGDSIDGILKAVGPGGDKADNADNPQPHANDGNQMMQGNLEHQAIDTPTVEKPDSPQEKENTLLNNDDGSRTGTADGDNTENKETDDQAGQPGELARQPDESGGHVDTSHNEDIRGPVANGETALDHLNDARLEESQTTVSSKELDDEDTTPADKRLMDDLDGGESV